jgi:hypothetical protein
LFDILAILDPPDDPIDFPVNFDTITMSCAHVTSFFIYLIKTKTPPGFDSILTYYFCLPQAEFPPLDFIKFAVFILSDTDFDISEAIFKLIPDTIDRRKIARSFIYELRCGKGRLR